MAAVAPEEIIAGRALAALLDLVAENGLGRRTPAEVEELLAAAFSQYPMFELFYVLDSRGLQISANVPNPAYSAQLAMEGRGVDRSYRLYWREVMATGHGYVSAPYRSTATQNFCLTVSCPLRDELGQLWAVLAGDVQVTELHSR